MTDVVADQAASPAAAALGRQALQAGAKFCDSQMVADGVTRSRLPVNNEVICTCGIRRCQLG